MPHLEVTGKEGESLRFPVADGRTLIGRSRQCQIAIKDSTLSARHAAIDRVNGGGCVVDLESTNGLVVSGKKVTSQELRPGAPFQLGRFTFTLVDETAPKVNQQAGPARSSPAVPRAKTPPAKPAMQAPAKPAMQAPAKPAMQAPARPAAQAPARPHVTACRPPRKSRVASIALSVLLMGGIAFGLSRWKSSQTQSTAPGVPASGPGSVSASVPAAPPPAPTATATPPHTAAVPTAATGTVPAHPPEPAPAKPDPFAAPQAPSMGMQPGGGADELAVIGLRNGDILEGKVLERNDRELAIEIPPQGEGKATQRRIPIEDVEQVNGELVAVDYRALFQVRLGEADEDAEALWKMAEWCDRFRLPAEKGKVLEKLLAVAPDHEAAHRALGHVRFQGQWYTPEQCKEKGLGDASGRFKVDLATRQYLRRVVVDLLGRAPMEEDFAQAMGEKREETVARLVACKERFAFWYEEELYYFLLLDQNHPASKNLIEIPDRLAAGDEGIWDALHEIVISQYFNARNPGNDTYATVVLEQLMGMTVQKHPDVLERAKKMYDNYKQVLFTREGASQADLVQIIMDQEDTCRFFVKRQYEKLVGKAIDKETLDRDAKRLMEDQLAWNDIVKGWILSPAYEGSLGEMKKKSDQVFIRALYVDLLKRLPTYQELRSMRNAMQALADPGPLRNVMAKVMVDSDQVQAGGGDAKAWIVDEYVKYLCREPSAKELSVLGGAMASGKATPKMVLDAILSSAEYQYY